MCKPRLAILWVAATAGCGRTDIGEWSREIGGMAGAIGSILFPVFIGTILQFYKNAGNIVAGYNIIFLVCGSSFLIAWAIIHFIIPKMEKAKF